MTPIVARGVAYVAAYRTPANASGDVVLFFHGWNVVGHPFRYAFAPELEPLYQRGVSLVSIETPCGYWLTNAPSNGCGDNWLWDCTGDFELSSDKVLVDRIARRLLDGSFGARLTRVHLFGHSSGGFLVFRLCTRASNAQVPFRVASAVVYAAGMQGYLHEHETGVRDRFPPVLFVHNSNDTVVKSETSYAAWMRAGNTSRRIATGSPHACPYPVDVASQIVDFYTSH